jgi:muconolactone D-isomerase
MSLDDLWNSWEKEAEAAMGAKAAGKVEALYKVCGPEAGSGHPDVKSHDELDRIIMAGLPMANYLEIEEVLPVREYERFADDVKRRWK